MSPPCSPRAATRSACGSPGPGRPSASGSATTPARSTAISRGSPRSCSSSTPTARREWVTTDASWRASTGPITASGLYAGEDYDARLALVDADGRGFAEAGYDDSRLGAAVAELDAIRHARGTRVAVRAPPRGARGARGASPPRAGRTVLDFGQNLVGRLRIRVSGPGRHRGHPAARRGARARRARHAAAARRRGDRPLHARRRRRSRNGSRSSRSTGSATPRSTGGRVSSTRPPSPPS